MSRRPGDRKPKANQPDLKRRSTAPRPSSEIASGRMRAVRQLGTSAEANVTAELRRRGIRLRRNFYLTKFRCRPDFVSVKERLAVFIDGCFWHGCTLHGTMPKANRTWWQRKLAANRQRDEAVTERLRLGGWAAFRFWGHDSATFIVEQIANYLSPRRTEPKGGK